jgi:glucosamine 6-phosphate synthetase-like amidotransferase/phosphosugar isomerase protein
MCFIGEPVAMEGALKLKEMAYLHAEGYSGGALKHGPFALLEVFIYTYITLLKVLNCNWLYGNCA